MCSTIKQLINLAYSQLLKSKIDSALLDIQILLSKAIDKDRSFVICNPEFIVTKSQKEVFRTLIDRRSKHEPVSHIIGYREFYSRDFIVTKDVLDPRADTETLIDIVKEIYSNNHIFNFLDIGCGSGAISVTILAEFTNSKGFCIDISEKALNIAQKNAKKHKVDQKATFIKSNIFEKLPKNSFFDLIISNPPYIPSKNIEFLEKQVSEYDPKIALDGGDDGLDFYRFISKNAQKYLKTGGKLLFEIGFDQKIQIIDILSKDSYKNIKSFKDLGKNDRAILAEM